MPWTMSSAKPTRLFKNPTKISPIPDFRIDFDAEPALIVLRASKIHTPCPQTSKNSPSHSLKFPRDPMHLRHFSTEIRKTS